MNPYDYLNEDDAQEHIINTKRKLYLSELDIEMDFMDYISGSIPKHLNYEFAITMLLENDEVIDIVIEDEELIQHEIFESIEAYNNERYADPFVNDYPSYAEKLVNKIKSEFADVLEIKLIRL